MRKAAIYLRVSTTEQNLDSQKIDTERAARNRGMKPVIFKDHTSGAKTSRKGLDEMMARIRRGEFSALICYKLDRLGRSLPHLAQLIGELDANQVGLIAVGQGIDTTENNPAARLQLHVLMAVAEFERSLIRERTLAGLEAAKRRGARLGRPKGSKTIPDARKRAATRILEEDSTISCARLGRAVGVSVGTAHAWKKELLSRIAC